MSQGELIGYGILHPMSETNPSQVGELGVESSATDLLPCPESYYLKCSLFDEGSKQRAK